MTKQIVRGLLCLLIASASASAETRRVLVPTVAGGVTGAYGSVWRSELWAHGHSAGTFLINIPIACSFPLCQPVALVPQGHTTIVPLMPQAGATGLVGHTDAAPGDVAFSLRIQDISRQALTWGTTIPVVFDTEFKSTPATVFPVPIADRFRSTLRIYALDGNANAEVLVRAFEVQPSTGRLLAARAVQLGPPPAPAPGVPQFKPWYAQLDVEALFPEAAADSLIRIECAPVSADFRIWAFVSVTNDETQHVTVVTP